MTDPDLIDSLRAAHERTQMVGWDFSQLDGRMSAGEPWWDFEADCASAMAKANRIADLGTAGGERLVRLLDGLPPGERTVVATEGWHPNLAVASQNLQPRGVEVRWYDAEQGGPMPFQDGELDLVMSRHEAIAAVEIARVLAPGGRCLTQQVDGFDAGELHDWFRADVAYPHVTSQHFVAELEAAGLVVDVVDDWQGTMEFADAEALVTYLALVPWDVPGFRVDDHAPILATLDDARPIRVTQRRFRIHATRPRQRRAPDEVFNHPRLAAVYDALDSDRSDLDVYAAMVGEFGASSVVDIGCGTGTLACMLAAAGHRVVGVDPAEASLAIARTKPHADAVTWVHGTAPDVLPLQVDLAFMTANVAQVFVDDADWDETLRAAFDALRPGGRLVFESRDPARRAWLEWTRERSFRVVDVPGEGEVEDWAEVTDVDGELVTFDSPTVFRRDGVRIESTSTLRFRSLDQLAASVTRAGFVVDEVRGAPDRPGREFVLVCRKP